MTDKYRLSHGSHTDRADGLCAMEWVAYIAGEPHTDQPVCVSPVLRSFCIDLNDRWDDDMRQRIRPYLARCIGTAEDGRDTERGYMCLDWQVRTFLPAWLDLAGMTIESAAIRALDPIVDLPSAKRAGPVVRHARDEASAAWDAARAAAGAAAWDAAWAAAWAAAGAAAGDAAWAAAGAAAGDAAWAAARDAAWAAAWAAARAAAGAALQPVVRELQESAFGLLDRMLPLEPLTIPERAAEAEALVTFDVGGRAS